VVNSGAPFPIWDPHFFTELVQKNSGTLSALVPTQIFDLVRAGLRAPESMRAIVVGGGNLNPALYAEARKLGWPVLPSYGLTECASQVATASLSSLEQDGYPELRLLSHVEVDAAASGARLRIRSQALLTGYLLETGSGAVFTDPKQNGWFTTEDLGSVTDGVLRVQGREGSFVKMGGESVDFARLERIFEEARLATGFAGDAMLVAVVDERLGHVTGVVVGEDREFAKEQLAALLEGFNQRVLPVERIRQVRRVPVIPRSALGKPLRN
jgi:O-succinylbenzoic acid--CoA ligase